MSKIIDIAFRSLDYKNTDSLSTYSIDIAPLLFIPDLPEEFLHRVVWDFGDDTTSRSMSAFKAYEFPGSYNVSLMVYDCETNVMVSSYTKQIQVYNFIPFTFNIFSDYMSLSSVVVKNGQFSDKLVVNAYYPNYQTASSIYYTIEGSNSLNYWDIKNNKFSHLEKTYSLYEKIYNFNIKKYQFKPLPKLDFNPIELYAKKYNNDIVYCNKDDYGSTFVGLSASKSIYIKDDSLVNNAGIVFKFDKTHNKIHIRDRYVEAQCLNTLGITLRYNIIENNDVRDLSITSSGLDGEYYSISSFNISDIKFFDSKIPFVIKIKDSVNTSVKNFPVIQLSALNISIHANSDLSPTELVYDINSLIYDDDVFVYYGYGYDTMEINNTDYQLSSLNDSLTSYDHGGSFRGYIVFPQLERDYLDDVRIRISGSFVNDQSITYNLNAWSNRFNVYSKNYYDVWKINEDFDPQMTLMDLRFQETLLDKNVLFENFLGGAFGDSESDHESIGIKLYEKTANFTQNIQDVDTCELEFLDSLGDFIGFNDKGEERYIYPEKIKRLVNLGSIDKFKLAGTPNKFRENFDTRGRSTKDEYGTNIGNQIESMTYTVDSEVPIVALEKFSNIYTLLNTYQPLSATYPLSAYSPDWGWPLVLPNIIDFSDIEKYYLFFEYVEKYDNTILGAIIDFKNPKTTATIDDIHNNTFKHMSMDVLYQSLNLMGQ